MDIENLKDLKELLFYRGIGEKFNNRLEEQIKSGKPEFFLEDVVGIHNDETGYRLHFKRDKDPAKDKVYWNSFDVGLFKIDGEPGQVREHNFRVDSQVTAMEAYRMLRHGLLVAVNKNLFNKEGNQYNTWLSVDIKGEKDQYGNYPVKSYHENYYKKQPFVVKEALTQLPVPVKELESAQGPERIEKMLKKAQLVPVTIMLNGEEVTGSLAVNPKAGQVDVYDSSMQLVTGKEQVKKEATEQKNDGKTVEQHPADDEKKKHRPQERVNWSGKTHQRKGQSF